VSRHPKNPKSRSPRGGSEGEARGREGWLWALASLTPIQT
jgi:hypothetical protein